MPSPPSASEREPVPPCRRRPHLRLKEARRPTAPVDRRRAGPESRTPGGRRHRAPDPPARELGQRRDRCRPATAASTRKTTGSSGILHDAAKLNASKAFLFGIVALAYAALEGTEAYGLWNRRRWAEWLTVLATSLLLIPEVWALTKSATVLKVGALVVNVAIVAYLLVRLRAPRPPAAETDLPRPVGSAAVFAGGARPDQAGRRGADAGPRAAPAPPSPTSEG